MDDPNPSEQRVQPAINPLSYEAPKDMIERNPPVNVLGATFAAIVGMAVSGVGILFVSMFLFVSINPLRFEAMAGLPPSPPRHALNRAIAVLYCLGAVGLTWAIFRNCRKQSRISIGRWLAIGLLIGLGLGCLIEGACFVAR